MGRSNKERKALQAQQQSAHGWLGRPFRWFWWLVGTVGTIGGLSVFFGPFWPVEPTITASWPSQTQQPFSIPFVVTNNSTVFGFRGLTYHCEAHLSLESSGPIKHVGQSVRSAPTERDIGPGESFFLECPLGQNANVRTQLTASLSVSYIITPLPRVFGYSLRIDTDPVDFTWRDDLDPPGWMLGHRL